MQARVQELPFDPATLPGLSEKLLRSHHQNNYGGAVARLNAIRGQLAELAFASAPGFAPRTMPPWPGRNARRRSAL